jgi:hypothetical protein
LVDDVIYNDLTGINTSVEDLIDDDGNFINNANNKILLNYILVTINEDGSSPLSFHFGS